MRLRHYELVYILRTDAGDDVTLRLWERIYEIVKAHEGMTVKFETWGKRKLAYEIDKNSKGVYHYIQFLADSACVAEIQRNLRIHDAVLKFLTVLLNDDARMEDFEEAAVPQPGKVEKGEHAPDDVREAVATPERPTVKDDDDEGGDEASDEDEGSDEGADDDNASDEDEAEKE